MYQADEKRYETMQYNRCGNSGLLLPELSLGLWHNFGTHCDYKNMKALCFTAFDHGITHFDLANNYGPEPGSAERNFGRILKEDLGAYRDEILVSTKAGYVMWDGPYGNWGSKKYLIASLDQSLKRMGLEYVQFSESNSDEKLTIQKKADVLLGEFKSICDEINSGYDGGTRVRFIEDSTSTDGFRKLSKDDELSILLSEFSNFVEGRFGKTHQEESEKVAKIVNDLQKVKQEMGRGDIRYYEPEYIPSDFVEKLLKAASDYIKA
mgnify:CR=1 FL=1